MGVGLGIAVFASGLNVGDGYFGLRVWITIGLAVFGGVSPPVWMWLSASWIEDQRSRRFEERDL